MLSLEPAIVCPVVPATTLQAKMLFVQGARVLASAVLKLLARCFLPLFPVGPFEVLYLIFVFGPLASALISSSVSTISSATTLAPVAR